MADETPADSPPEPFDGAAKAKVEDVEAAIDAVEDPAAREALKAEIRAYEEATRDEPRAGVIDATEPPADEPTRPRSANRRYTREQLRERSRSLLDVSPHVVAAALANENAKNFTLKRAQELVAAAAEHEEEVDDHRAEAEG